MFGCRELPGLCQVNTHHGPRLRPSESSEMKTQTGRPAGTSSCLLLAGEEGLTLVIVTELARYQPLHLETVTKKEEA